MPSILSVPSISHQGAFLPIVGILLFVSCLEGKIDGEGWYHVLIIKSEAGWLSGSEPGFWMAPPELAKSC